MWYTPDDQAGASITDSPGGGIGPGQGIQAWIETVSKGSWGQGVNWGLGQPCQKREGSTQAWVGLLSSGVQAAIELLPRQFLCPASPPTHPPRQPPSNLPALKRRGGGDPRTQLSQRRDGQESWQGSVAAVRALPLPALPSPPLGLPTILDGPQPPASPQLHLRPALEHLLCAGQWRR